MVSISKSDSMLLQSVSTKDIDGHLQKRFSSTYTKLEKIHENENELKYITKYHGNNTEVSLWRDTHKPFDLQMKVEFKSKTQSDQHFRGVSGFSFLGMGFKNLFLIVGVFIILSILLFVISILTVIDRRFLVIVFLLIFFVLYYQIKPETDKGKYKKREAEAVHFIAQLKQILTEIRMEDENTVRKCWNCFKSIDLSDNVCAFCGKSQR